MNLRTIPASALVLLVLAATLVAGAPASADAPGLESTASPAKLTAGGTTTIAVAGAPPGAQLTLSRRLVGERDFKPVGTLTASASGTAAWTRKPPRSGVFRVGYVADDPDDEVSVEVAVGVRPRIELIAAAPKPLIQGRNVRYTIKVRPKHPGAQVRLLRRTDDGWVPLKNFKLNRASNRIIKVKAGKPGRLVVRAEMDADADHLLGRSPIWRVTVFSRWNPYGVPAKYPRLILVDLKKYKLYYHERGHVVRVFDCVLGRPGLPTPVGRFRIYAKDPRMGGPYGPRRMRYLGLYAIHGTNEPGLLKRFPRNYSHGCTRLSNANILWLYKRVKIGTPVWNVR